MKTTIAAALSLSVLSLAGPALAQNAAAPAAPAATAADPAATSAAAKAGDTVYDQAGEAVGTIESVSAPNFVISTGTNKATVPLSALGTGPKGPVIGMTKAQLDAAIANASGSAAPAGGAATPPAQK